MRIRCCLVASKKMPKRRCVRDGGLVVADVVQSGSDPALSVLFEECMHLNGLIRGSDNVRETFRMLMVHLEDDSIGCVRSPTDVDSAGVVPDGDAFSQNKIGQLPDARDCQIVLASMRCMGTLTDLDTILYGADGHHEP
jgi:hypothetical protein